jgi:putative flavoprotein involved in K+ transport
MNEVFSGPELGTETTPAEYVPTVVIGGGQAGLVIGYHLQRAGERFVILEANPRVGDSWRKRWDSLRLFSLPKYASLPGWPIQTTVPPTKDEMADYLESYVRHFSLPVRTGVRTQRLARHGDGFVVHTSAGDLFADRVVLATGGYLDPYVPTFADELAPDIRQLHSVQYRNPDQLADGDVLIVGAGNSGAEIALDAVRSGHRTWVAGRHPGQVPIRIDAPQAKYIVPVIMFLFRRVLTLNTPMGRKARVPALEHGNPLVRTKIEDLDAAGVSRIPRIAGVQEGKPVTTEGQTLDPKTVVWCTGFRPDYSWIDLPIVGTDGHPVHDRGVSPEPGLFFMGLEFQFSVASATIQGLDQDARYLIRRLRSAPVKRRTQAVPTDASDLEVVRITGAR